MLDAVVGREAQMKTVYDAIVIGSGFGGSVAACRLAEAGLSTVLLERGRRYDTSHFPRDWKNPANGWLWQVDQGLFDLKHLAEMMVIESAGLGGGSLIYANVHLRAPKEVFDAGWPQGYSRAGLDKYYDLVAYMLDIKPITESKHFTTEYAASGGLPPKTALVRKAATDMGYGTQFCYPNIAVDFGPPGEPHANKFGAIQKGCTYCGECDIGCEVHAKNTLDYNYLKVAQDRGAEIATQCEVTRIETTPSGYQVTFKDHTRSGQLATVQAGLVFVCGGAVNSTELLLRCRDQYRTLPKLSDRLGSNYSGNGDFLAFAFNTGEPASPSVGPTITTGIVYDRIDDGSKNWFIFEEGGFPKEIGGLVQVLNPKNGLLQKLEVLSKAELENLFAQSGAQVGVHSAAETSAVFLAMGRDRADGVISLHPITFGLQIDWSLATNGPLYAAQERFSRAVARSLGGDAAFNPFWSHLHLPVSVHNLGGCPLGDTPDRGVVDPNGEVFNYPGLFVLDGAAIPVAIGANPSHTIAAVAERNIESAIRKYGKGTTDWQAPQTALAKPVRDPLSEVVTPAGGTRPLA